MLHIPGEGMMGCWFKKGCVSGGIWLVGVFALRRPDTTGALAVVIAGLGSVLGSVGWGFMNWARGSNPEFKSWDESRDGTETWTGGWGTNDGLDWRTWGGIWGCGATGPTPLQMDCCGLFVSLLEVFFFCCLGTSPSRQMIYDIYRENMRKLDLTIQQLLLKQAADNYRMFIHHSQNLHYQRSRCCLKMKILSSSLSHLLLPEISLLQWNTTTTFRNLSEAVSLTSYS